MLVLLMIAHVAGLPVWAFLWKQFSVNPDALSYVLLSTAVCGLCCAASVIFGSTFVQWPRSSV